MSDYKNRIELHCHSKAGGCSTMYPGEIIKYLTEMEMPAFAITDESTINAFPELEMVWKTGNYTARPIYGMEVMLQGETPEETNSISVLVKNEIGKKALYKIISENDSTAPHPVYDMEKFIENHDGFLLGSGADNGHLYKLALAGASDDILQEEMSRYDYVEVLPYAQYESVNKQIIKLSDALNIPVVAISDARYLDKIGRKALQIMQHWNEVAETTSDNHIWTTEEMLQAFDYLPKEKAYEIVVENTHMLAEQCETISVCPKGVYYPKVQNAEARLKEKCNAALPKKYSENLDNAGKRLAWELDAISKTGMAFYLLQIEELLSKTGFTANNISMRGAGAGSIVAYLLDISNVDPLKFGLEPEVIFDVDGSRLIDIDINLPTNSQLAVIERVSELEGVGKYVWAGTHQVIADPLAQAMIERYMQDAEEYWEEDVIDKLRWKISGNYLGRGKHPGGVFIIPDDCDCTELMPVAKLQGGFEITYFNYHNVDYAFVKLDLLKHNVPEMLNKLETLTEVKLEDVPIESEEVLKLFESDESGCVTACADLPEFKSEYVRTMVAELKPKTFSQLAKIVALAHGTDTWMENGEVLAKEQGITVDELIATRDDIFAYVLGLGIDRDTTFKISEAIRKGVVSRGRNTKWQSWKNELLEAGAPEWYIWSCQKIRYLFPRAHVVSYLIMNMKLGWFKVHYPDAFYAVMKEYEEPVW